MAATGIDIDEIVRRVLSAVGGKPTVVAETAAQAPTAEKGELVVDNEPLKPKSATPSDVLTLDTAVVTLEQLRGRASGIRHIVLRPGALITPAARDALREHDIKVSTAAEATTRDGTATLVIGVADTSFNLEPLSNMLHAKGIDAESIGAKEVVSAVREIVKRVCDGQRLGVLVTDKPFPAVCLANRHPGVRAVQAGDLSSLSQAMASVGANMLVATPEGTSGYQLARLIQQFVIGGPRCCPEAYREHLEES